MLRIAQPTRRTHSDQCSPDNVKFPDDSLTVCGTPLGTQHVKCYWYHAHTSVTVSAMGRNAAVHDPKPYT